IDGEHIDVVGHPDENEGPNAKEDPSNAAIDGEHMNAIGSPDETEEPNAHDLISPVLNTPVDNEDVLMTDAHDTINLANPPSHESEITSPCGSEKKGDELDGAKANQEDVPTSLNTVKPKVSFAQKSLNPSLDFIIDKYQKKKVVRKPKIATSTAYIRRSKRHKQGVFLTADNGEVVNEPQLPDSHERYKKNGTLLQDFLPVIGKDGKEIKLEPWIEDLTRDSKATKIRIHVSKKFWISSIKSRSQVIVFLGVYIPLNIKNAHWFLAEFKIRTGVVTFYDTLSGLEYWETENHDWWLSLQVMMIEQLPQGMLANGLSMDFPPGPIQTA
nr:hypothetical protein [Tanacetum cinerariifolium]